MEPQRSTRDPATVEDRAAKPPPGTDLSKTGRAPAAGDRPAAARRRQRGKLYGWAIAIVVLVAILISFVVANTESVTIDWLVSDSRLSLVWVIFGAAVIGWILGIATSVIFRRRTRASRAA